ncbi:MAG: hypothetical protein WBQ94_13375 [Terracidiphilus sp.]
MKRFWKTLFVTALVSAAAAHAEVASQSKTIVVMQPRDLPQTAQAAGQSMQLHAFSNGVIYLYIEQHQLGRLAVLDVTDPARIKQVAEAKMDIPDSFDFGAPLNDSVILVNFRDGKGSALLDLRKPKEPTLTTASPLLVGASAEKIGRLGLLLANGSPISTSPAVQDYSIVDSSNPATPRLLGTVRNVRKELVNEDTGTTYLLGEDGLTVIRQPAVELQYHLQSTYTN